MRFAIALALISSVVSSSGAEPVTRAPTAAETAALQEPIELGNRVYKALHRYFDRPLPRVPRASTGLDVLTEWPTAELLHAVGYIDDSDMRLVQQYRVTISPVVFNKPTEPVLTMQTKYGQLIFDVRGEITLQPR